MTATEVPPAVTPPGAREQMAQFIGLTRAAEEELAKALILVAERRRLDPEIAQTATVLAGWSREHMRRLATFADRYGARPNEHPASLRRALFQGTGVGPTGTLLDLRDASLLVWDAEMAWTILYQGAKGLHEDQLVGLAGVARDHVKRGLRWFRTVIELQAPEALAVPPP
jgi:hypothetical protein